QNKVTQNLQQQFTESEQKVVELSRQVETTEQAINQTQEQLKQEIAQKEHQVANLKRETTKRSELETEIKVRSDLIEQLNKQLEEQQTNYGLLDLKGNEQQELIGSLRSQLAEQSSLTEKSSAASSNKNWVIILLSILLTAASVISAQSYL
ncbi:MAG: hypothetical protein AAFY50_21000, partial [Cyanobacteria bacterium J06648_1]